MTSFIPSPKLILVTLANGDAALFVNGDAVVQYDASFGGDRPATIGDSLAAALQTKLHVISMDVPLDEDWNWNDVYELLPPDGEPASECAMQVSLDGGVTYAPAINGVRVIYEGLPRPDSDEENGQLHVNLTDEGVIYDVWTPDAGESLGTSAQEAADIAFELEEGAPKGGDLWADDSIQFPRLLCEIAATQDLDMDAIESAMDINSERLAELFDRANDAWEAAKQRALPAAGPRG
jgi:hypothetical protein